MYDGIARVCKSGAHEHLQDSMTTAAGPSTHRATFAIGDEATARRAVDVLNESLDDGSAAVAAFERADGRWDISIHFAEAPDQRSMRELVRLSAGEAAAQAIGFDTVEATDWVAACLEDLAPVPAGRFIVHGRHDRARLPANRIGIQIEAALAFGTGHHGTTRGCVLLLDQVLRSRVPRRVLDLGAGTGVLGHQAQGGIASYRGRGLVLRRHLTLDGWSSLLMQRAG